MNLYSNQDSYNSGSGGGPLSRMTSFSHVTPSTLTGYHDFFRRSSNREDGWIDIKVDSNDEWMKRWIIFDDGVLSYGPGPSSSDDQFIKISIDSVISFRTDASNINTIIINTTNSKLQLRAMSTDEMRKWLFCFQKSVALLLSRLIDRNTTTNFRKSQDGLNDSDIVWIAELGHGHGKQSALAKKRKSLTDNNSNITITSRAMTVEDANLWQRSDRSFLDLTRAVSTKNLIGLQIRDVNSGIVGIDTNASQSRQASMSYSNAIPISLTDAKNPSSRKLAGSYVSESDSVGALVDLEEAIIGLSLSPHDSSDRLRTPSESDDEGCEESMEMIFDFDDSHKSKEKSSTKASPTVLRRKSASSPLHERNKSKKALSWKSGFCSVLGPRRDNEDRLVALPNLNDVESINDDIITDNIGFFAVYDGHSGAQASKLLEETLHIKICKHPLFEEDLQAAISDTCVQVDKEFLALCKEKRMYCGTTALGAFIVNNKITVFNLGDCHAVICSNGVALDMSIAHKPGRPDESERIIAANGWITEEKELYMGRLHRMDLSDPLVRDKAQQVNWVTINRVCGELAVSRSIGDPDYKSFEPGAKVDSCFLWPENHNQIFMADLVIPVPEFKTKEISNNDEFCIIASDGLWDVMSGAEATLRVKQSFSDGKSATETAEELCDLALKLGSSDNVTIVIIQFVHGD